MATPPPFAQGDHVLYRSANPTREEGGVELALHFDDGEPPYYTVLLRASGRERQTSASRLRVDRHFAIFVVISYLT